MTRRCSLLRRAAFSVDFLIVVVFDLVIVVVELL